MIRVVVIITAKPGQRDAVLAAFNANVPNVRAEAGCLEYGAVVDAEGGPGNRARLGPDSFMVIETWDSEQALAAHIAAPHMAAYAARVKDLLASRTLYVLTPAT